MSSEIRFEPAGVAGLVAQGTTLAAAAERLGVRIELACGGRGECTSCAIVMEQNPLSLSPLTEAEERLLTAEQLHGSARLACQARVGEGDCVVRVPPQAEAAGAEGASPGEARARIRESFSSLPVGEQIAAILEMEVNLARGVFDAIVEGPLKAGEELVASLFGSPGGKTDGSEDANRAESGEAPGPAGESKGDE
jgi:ferredoxin